MPTFDFIVRIISTLATLSVGVAASFLAYRQYKLAQVRLKLDLYQKRLALFRLAIEFADDLAEGRYNDSTELLDRLWKFHSDTIENRFLFEYVDIHSCFDELYQKAEALAASLAVRQIRKTGETIDLGIQHAHAQERAWFRLQESRLIALFEKPLSIRTLQ